jgi:transmembrane sensor
VQLIGDMKISEHQFRELLDRYLNGTATPPEREMLDSFFDSYDRPALDDSAMPFPDPELRDEILRRIHARTNKSKRIGRPKISWMLMAAAVALFIVTYYLIDKPNQIAAPDRQAVSLKHQTTAAGEKGFLTLSDGTQVYLNSNTKMSYPQKFGKTSREVTIEGEAFFKVVRDGKPFVVHTGGLETQVLGTAFNVKSKAGGDVEVTLVEGTVNVVLSSGRSSLLKPGQQAIVALNSTEISTKNVNVLRFTSWKDNILFFDHTTLRDAIADIESWYAVTIEIENPALLHCVITGKYQNEPLANVLSSFQFLLNLNIRRLDATHYSINGKGCK